MQATVTTQYVNSIGAKLTYQLGFALEHDSLTMEELPRVARFILDHIFTIRDHPALVSFLEDLSKKWEFFSGICLLEKGKIIEQETQSKVKEITKMIESHNLDQAILAANQVAAIKKATA